MINEVETAAKLMAERNLTIALAESVTAGRIASEFSLTKYSGKILKGGVVCYDACIKEDVLKVPHKLIKEYTPESAEVTAELTKRLKALIPADIHVGVTGLSTDGGSETPEKPVGTIFIHIILGEKSLAFRSEFKGTPEKIVRQTVIAVARLLQFELTNID